MVEVKTATGDEEFVFEGNWVKTIKGVVGEVIHITPNKLKIKVADKLVSIKHEEVFYTGTTEHEVDIPLFEVNHIPDEEVSQDKTPVVSSITVYDTLQEIHNTVTKNKEELPENIEVAVNDAIRHLYDFLAGRNSVNGKNTLDSAIKLTIQAKSLVNTEKDNRVIYG